MTAFNNRVIKSKLIDSLERQGFKVSGTDSANITIFSDKPFDKRSHRLPKSSGYNQPFITSFGEKTALKFLKNLRL